MYFSVCQYIYLPNVSQSNKKIGQTRFSSTCFESRLSLKGGGDSVPDTQRDTLITILREDPPYREITPGPPD